jgi:predicted acetyltransferase
VAIQIRPLRDSELPAAFELDADAFHHPESGRATFLRTVDPARVVGAFDGGRLVAMTVALPFGQFFGGRSVPMGAVAAVAVVPDFRGSGLAKRVTRACIGDMRERGEAISSLFPGTTGLYRALGWELAGSYTIRKLVPRLLRDLPRPARGRARPATAADQPAIRACYAAFARTANGCLDRHDHWWSRRGDEWRDRQAFVFEGEAGAVEGYLVYHQEDGEWSQLGGDFAISIDEIVACTRDASLCLWGLIASWSTQVAQVWFHGGADDPVLFVMQEQVLETLAEIRWLTRVLDAPAAVAARGFPPGLDVEVPLRIRDAEVAGNDGGFVLTVQKGEGRLASAPGAGGPALDVRGFASLYTGYAGTAALARADLLAGGSAGEHAALDAAFAGPSPWLIDEF